MSDEKKIGGKARVMEELSSRYNPYLARFASCIARNVELSDAYTGRLLNELAREGKARRIGGFQVCWQAVVRCSKRRGCIRKGGHIDKCYCPRRKP